MLKRFAVPLQKIFYQKSFKHVKKVFVLNKSTQEFLLWFGGKLQRDNHINKFVIFSPEILRRTKRKYHKHDK